MRGYIRCFARPPHQAVWQHSPPATWPGLVRLRPCEGWISEMAVHSKLPSDLERVAELAEQQPPEVQCSSSCCLSP
jgi:hypothetical protein